MGEADLRKLDELIAQDPRCTRPVRLQNCLRLWVAANEDAGRSPNFASQSADDVDGIVTLLGSVAVAENDELAMIVLKTLKILSRKYDNRIRQKPCAVPCLS